MMNQFDDFQKLGKENMDATMKALGAFSMGAQQIAVESTDFAKKSFEHSTATLEKLVGAKTLDKAIEIQTDYVKSAYESMVAQSSKMGELYANLMKDAMKPVEAMMAKPAK
ncbi:phasin family protein [Salinarimonas chemoclinalis]|uniref:phasin family protein n=1 Tax=Salinarimonas chemoclinalis TaxID=3241599 RepID=UPI003555D8AB